jgi:catechol 2,3-dioxygenase-like lactoylglutathione lyase family enzyme
MKRLHVSVAVSNLDNSIRFYSILFGAEPAVLKTDYAKWMLEDPPVNFSISSRGMQKGIDHLGIQVDDDAELATLTERLARAGHSVHKQKATTCCYAKSNKAWVHDPEGIAWEAFHTFGESPTYSGGDAADGGKSSTCDTPRASKWSARIRNGVSRLGGV